MSSTTETVQTTSSVGSDVKNVQPKRKGPKPSSKKRIEKFRQDKNRDTLAEIHRAATERTSVSLDALLDTLKELQIIAQKQEVVVPITTRGVGFLVNESLQEASVQCPKAVRNCSFGDVYRVSLAQLQHQLDRSDASRKLNDPIVEEIETANPRMTPEMTQQVASFPQNFSLVAELVNSVGRFELAQTSYRPEVVDLKKVQVEEPEPPATPKRRRRVVDNAIPDPYSVTFNNLRATVVALSNPLTPEEHRVNFINANPIPGACFANNLLLNANEIMPEGYTAESLAFDQRRVRAMIELLSPKCSHLVGKCNFSGNGSCAQLVTTYKEHFRLENMPSGDLTNLLRFPNSEIRFRCIRQLEPGFIVRGAICLLGEYPLYLDTDRRLYGIREPPHHESYFDASWGMLAHRAFSR